ncbi:5923_t:CDS:2 [Entrophospora sp. SA101]|nr:5923_t:CDS:2 [Entrophospora sp. SA101]
MGKRNRSSLLPTNLPQLQNLIKRDSISYRDDFLQQYRHYESQLDIFKIKPDEETEEFGKLGEDGITAKKSLDICIELYRKGIWNDNKTVNVIAEACFHSLTKVKVTAIKFFLGSNKENQDDDSDNNVEVDLPDIKRLQHINQINKSKKSKTRKLEKALSTVRKKERQKHKAENFNFSAINLINDPQGFAEKLFSSLQKSSNNDRFEVKLMMMNLISRIIGINKLILLNFYSYLLRYLQPHQRDVTMVLVILAQASHELVPPDVLEPVIKAVANKFVSDNCSSEVITAGLNGIREVCVRQPLAMDSTLLQDLTEYKGDRDKGVMMAARSLIGLFREINPEILKKRDRGKIAKVKLEIEELKFDCETLENENIIIDNERKECEKNASEVLSKANDKHLQNLCKNIGFNNDIL